MARVPQMFDKLAGNGRQAKGRGTNLESAREPGDDFSGRLRPPRLRAGLPACLNLDEIQPGRSG